MLPINPQNRHIALQVLTTAFGNNPGVLWVVKKDKHIRQRIKVLCKFCLGVAMQKQGAYITADLKGIALIFRNTMKQDPFRWLTGYIQLGHYCIGWNRAIKVIRREMTITGRRPQTPHLYFWMLAVEDHTYGLNTIIEIRDFVFNQSKMLQLPIYAETTVESALTLYKRYGFKVYDKWQMDKSGLTVYFIYRDWDV